MIGDIQKRLFLHQRLAASTWWCSPSLLSTGGPKCRVNFSEGSDRPINPNCLECFFYAFASSSPLTGCGWTAILLIFYDQTVLCSPPFSRLFIFLVLLVSGNVHPSPGPAPIRLTLQNFHAPSAPARLGESLFSVADARGGSTPPASGSLKPPRGPSSPGVTWVAGSVHLVPITHLIELQYTLTLWHLLYIPLWYHYSPHCDDQ